jgi:hypothetical protein
VCMCISSDEARICFKSYADCSFDILSKLTGTGFRVLSREISESNRMEFQVSVVPVFSYNCIALRSVILVQLSSWGSSLGGHRWNTLRSAL